MKIFAFPFLNLALAAKIGGEGDGCDCSTFNADMGSPASCDEAECLDEDGCGDGCGLEDCAAMVCLLEVDVFTISACDDTDPTSGMVESITLQPDVIAARLIAYSDTIDGTSGFTFDPATNACTVEETFTGRAKITVAGWCGFKARKKKEIVVAYIDGCDRIFASGLRGGTYLTSAAIAWSTAATGECGINFTISNTKKEGHFVDWAGMGYASAEDAINGIFFGL